VYFILATGHYLNLRTTASRAGYVAQLGTKYIDTTGMCLELFFWPIVELNSLDRPILSVLAVSEEKTATEWAWSTGYELRTWNRLFTKLPDGIHRVIIEGRRSISGQSGMSIDDIVVQPCVTFGKTQIG